MVYFVCLAVGVWALAGRTGGTLLPRPLVWVTLFVCVVERACPTRLPGTLYSKVGACQMSEWKWFRTIGGYIEVFLINHITWKEMGLYYWFFNILLKTPPSPSSPGIGSQPNLGCRGISPRVLWYITTSTSGSQKSMAAPTRRHPQPPPSLTSTCPSGPTRTGARQSGFGLAACLYFAGTEIADLEEQLGAAGAHREQVEQLVLGRGKCIYSRVGSGPLQPVNVNILPTSPHPWPASSGHTGPRVATSPPFVHCYHPTAPSPSKLNSRDLTDQYYVNFTFPDDQIPSKKMSLALKSYTEIYSSSRIRPWNDLWGVRSVFYILRSSWLSASSLSSLTSRQPWGKRPSSAEHTVPAAHNSHQVVSWTLLAHTNHLWGMQLCLCSPHSKPSSSSFVFIQVLGQHGSHFWQSCFIDHAPPLDLHLAPPPPPHSTIIYSV